MRDRAAALHAEIDAAAATMRADATSAFEATRVSIRDRAAACRQTLLAERDARKAELAERCTAERDRVVEAATGFHGEVQEKVDSLAAAANGHGATQAASLTAHAQTRGATLQLAGAAIAQQYVDHDRANDIRVTVTRMANDGAASLTSSVAEEAQALADDGVALDEKLRGDGQTHLDNLAQGEALGGVFDGMLAEAQAEVDARCEDMLAEVEANEASALAEVDGMQGAVDGQFDTVVSAQHAGVDLAAEQALTGLEAAGQSAFDALDAEVESIEGWLASAHPSQWITVSQTLNEAADGLSAQADAVASELAGIGGEAFSALDSAGQATIDALGTVASDLRARLDEIVGEVEAALGETERCFGDGLAAFVETQVGGWVSEADDRVGELTEARDGALRELQQTHDDGIAEIDGKHADALSALDEQAGGLRTGMQDKAREIAEASWLDRALSALSSFVKGLIDSVVGFLKAILIVALVVLAVVAVVALVIFLVGGAAAVAAAATAVAAFLTSAATALAAIATVLTVIGVAFAVISVVSAWMNPDLTWEEKWQATGKGVGDIALEFLPDFGMSLLTRGDDVADVAGVVRQLDAVDDAVRALDDPASVAGGLRALDLGDEAADLTRAGDDLADAFDDASRVADQADDLVRQADDLPAGGPGTTRPSVDVDGPSTRPADLDGPSTRPAGPEASPKQGFEPEAPTRQPEGADVEPAGGAPRDSDELVDLTDDKARSHILDGDSTGGGHRPGTGEPGKTEFPEGWSDDEILHHVSDVATDPAAVPGPNNSPNLYNRMGKPNRQTFTAIKEGVEIKVVYEPATGRIVSAYPVGVVDPVTGAITKAPVNPPLSVLDDVAPPSTGGGALNTAGDAAGGVSPSKTPQASKSGPAQGVDEVVDGAAPAPGGQGQGAGGPEAEWLRIYRERVRLEQTAAAEATSRLQQAYTLFKGVGVATFLVATGARPTAEALRVIRDAWTEENRAKAAELEGEQKRR